MRDSFKTRVFKDKLIAYTGDELSSHWIYKHANLLGDAAVAFVGECNVPITHMVDAEDVKNDAPIYSPKMLHFIAECFWNNLEEGILFQHLFVSMVYQSLLERKISHLRKTGNDLFYQDRKLSVSIVTKTTLSLVMHFGINIETAGTPVPTAGLQELGIEPYAFAEELLQKLTLDSKAWAKARVKVLPR